MHRLTNVTPANRRSGTVGNVNTTLNTFAIIDPVTGTVIGGPHTYTGDLLQVGGAAGNEAAFDAAINEGDTVAGTIEGSQRDLEPDERDHDRYRLRRRPRRSRRRRRCLRHRCQCGAR